MSSRSELLAARIEQGAETLASFVEYLSDAEWQMPVSPTDRRSIGIVVHHVATVYAVEVELARAIASGHAVTNVTPEAVDQMNAHHARELLKPNQAETVGLLRRSSRSAAAKVREFTDEQLDQAAPFSLSFGAPVTAQFVIEDHALRHSWHHLARIRTALKQKAPAPSRKVAAAQNIFWIC
jgi:hypothetical protein